MRSILSIMFSSLLISTALFAVEPLLPMAGVTPVYKHKGKPTVVGRINNHASSIYLSFANDVQTLGPKFPLNERLNAQQAQEYVQWTFREIVRKAHYFIKDKGEFGYEPGSDLNHSYYSFLVLALAVPLHEGQFMHFREQVGEKCVQKANQMKYSGPKTKKILSDIYRKPGEPLLPDCDVFDNEGKINQLVFSYGHEDIGIMQINPDWHGSTMEPSVLLNTSNFIQYGIEYLYDGYMKVRRNLDEDINFYPCSMYYDPYKDGKTAPKIFYNLLRATWASKYNSGKRSQICRFISTNKFDDGFEDALSGLVVGSSSILHRYLPKGSVELDALNEILNNYYRIFVPGKQTEQDYNLRILLSLPEKDHQKWAEPRRTKEFDPTHTLKEAKTPIYSIPGESKDRLCGYLDTRGLPGSQVKVIGQEFYKISGSKKHQRWAEIWVSDYAIYLNLIENAPSDCELDRLYIRSDQLKQLPIDYIPGKSYQALVNVKGSLNTRICPGLHCDVISNASLRGGDLLTVVGDDSENGKKDIAWYKVIVESGADAWVSESYIDLVEAIDGQ